MFNNTYFLIISIFRFFFFYSAGVYTYEYKTQRSLRFVSWCFNPGLLLAGDRRPGRRPRYWFDLSMARLCLARSRL